MNKYLIIICVVLGIVSTTLFSYVGKLKYEKERLSGNQQALMEKIEFYQTEAGKSAASVQKLELSKSELEEHCSDLMQTIDQLNIKVKRLEAASTTATETDIDISTSVRDSIIYRDTSFVKIQAIDWMDPWVKVKGVLYPDRKLELNINSVDTLVQIVHRVPKKWWFFRWGTKAIRQEIISSNPHTKIVYTEYIELKDKKKCR